MKLLRCNKCGDVVSLNARMKRCGCGASSGRYLDAHKAEYCGPCVMIGIANYSWHSALALNDFNPPSYTSRGHRIEAFIIPESSPNVKRV